MVEEQDLRQIELNWPLGTATEAQQPDYLLFPYLLFDCFLQNSSLWSVCGVPHFLSFSQGLGGGKLSAALPDPGSRSRTSRNAGRRPPSPHPRALGQTDRGWKISFLPYLCMLENLSESLSNIKPHCYTLNKQSMGKNIVSCGPGTVCHPSSHRPQWSAGEDFPSEMPQPDRLSSPSFLHPGLLPPVLMIP